MENPTEVATELVQNACKSNGKTLAIAAISGVAAAGAARFGWKKFRNRKAGTTTETTTETPEIPTEKKK